MYHVEGKYIILLNKPLHTLFLDQKHFESAAMFPCALYTIEQTKHTFPHKSLMQLQHQMIMKIDQINENYVIMAAALAHLALIWCFCVMSRVSACRAEAQSF